MANAPPKGKRPNACFVPCLRTKTARIEVTRRIVAGGEIFISYGPNYWRYARSTTHTTSNIPAWEWDISNPFAPPTTTTSAQPDVTPVLQAGTGLFLDVPDSPSSPIRCYSPTQLDGVPKLIPPTRPRLAVVAAPKRPNACFVPCLRTKTARIAKRKDFAEIVY